MLQERLGTLSGLASMLGLRAPVTFSDAADLLAVAELAAGAGPARARRGCPPRATRRPAKPGARSTMPTARSPGPAADASAYFTPEVLQHDVEGLARRFAGEHQGLGKLSAEYRADKRAVAAFTRDDIARETAYQQLPLAAAWQSAAQALAAAEASYAPLLGRYYAGAATDFDRLGRALTHAADAVHRAHGQDLRKAAGHIGADALPNPAITAIAAEARAGPVRLAGDPGPRPATAGRPELLNGTIAEAIGWLRAHLGAAARGRRVHPPGQRGRGQAADLRPGPAPGGPAGGGRRRARTAGRAERGVPRRCAVTCTRGPRPMSPRSGPRSTGPGACAR